MSSPVRPAKNRTPWTATSVTGPIVARWRSIGLDCHDSGIASASARPMSTKPVVQGDIEDVLTTASTPSAASAFVMTW